MPTKVVMPQMGESVAEGTITKWLKKVGDRIEQDEPLFEITTDKVDADIPSPAAGILAKILARRTRPSPSTAWWPKSWQRARLPVRKGQRRQRGPGLPPHPGRSSARRARHSRWRRPCDC